MAVTTPATGPNLVSRLRNVHVDLRDDLEISRHLFQGEPAYIVRDPISFQSHRFSLADYRILVAINSQQPLAAVFEGLVKGGQLSEDREAEFYDFILFLHRVGFLNLPIADGRLLYRRYKASQLLKKRRRLFSFVYLDIPLWNPDAFLGRTVQWVRPLFSREFFLAWLGLVAFALYVGIHRRRDLAEPLTGLLAVQNLIIMWFTLSGLKAVHELGHAYACKFYGLHVPTLGVYLVAGVPCAYVDASASWGLASRRHRIVIGLAGMYFETVLSALALLVWAATPPGLANAIAFNVVFLASAATIVFNINPLMKYDGYFVLTDLVGIPNLGQRARDHVIGLVKRRLLRVPAPAPDTTGWRQWFLLFYGAAAPIYRCFVLVAITAVLASRFFLAGLILGGLYLTHTFSKMLRDMTMYLWRSEETAPVRGRAMVLSAVALAAVPAMLAVVPVRLAIRAPGVILGGRETAIRAETPGFLSQVIVPSGAPVRAGDPLVVLTNDAVADKLTEACTRRDAAQVRRDAFRVSQPAKALEEEQRMIAGDAEVRHRQHQLESLEPRTAREGRVLMHLESRDVGRFIPLGGEIATVLEGTPEIRCLLTSEDMAAAGPRIGQVVECRSSIAPGEVIQGTIETISPAGWRRVPLPSLTHLAGGEIAVAPETGEAMQPYFLVTIRMPDAMQGLFLHGGHALVRLPSRWEPVGLHLYRRVARFLDLLEKS